MDTRFTGLLRPFLKFAGDEEITPESRLRDLGLDSMQSIELLFAIEDEFAIALPDEDLNDRTFATAGSLWAAIASATHATELDGRSASAATESDGRSASSADAA